MGNLFSGEENLDRKIEKVLSQKLGEKLAKTDNVWKDRYEAVCNKYDRLIAQKTLGEAVGSTHTSQISDEAVDKFVKQLLDDPNINIRLLPDIIESGLYTNMLKFLLHLMAHTSNTAGITVLGHKIRIIIEPDTKSQISGETSSDQNSTQGVTQSEIIN
jgi:hypothetical protein